MSISQLLVKPRTADERARLKEQLTILEDIVSVPKIAHTSEIPAALKNHHCVVDNGKVIFSALTSQEFWDYIYSPECPEKYAIYHPSG